MKKLFSAPLALLFFLLSITTVFAAGGSNCQIIYGGGEVCPPGKNFTINKMVLSPLKGGGYVENLGTNDAKFAPNQNVTFQITVKNTGSSKINDMQVVDTFPQYLTFMSGEGRWDASNGKLTFTLDLDPGKSRTFSFVAKIANVGVFKSNEGIVCLINEARATDSTGLNGMDSTQFCVQKNMTSELPQPQVMKGGPITQTPPTGPGMLGLLALIPSGIGGFLLRRKSQKISQKGGGEDK